MPTAQASEHAFHSSTVAAPNWSHRTHRVARAPHCLRCRAGHAHAGVLLLMSLIYFDFIARTDLANQWMHVGCGLLIAGILGQSGGFFLHMVRGEAGKTSIGTTVTSVGALAMTAAITILVYGLFTAP